MVREPHYIHMLWICSLHLYYIFSVFVLNLYLYVYVFVFYMTKHIYVFVVCILHSTWLGHLNRVCICISYPISSFECLFFSKRINSIGYKKSKFNWIQICCQKVSFFPFPGVLQLPTTFFVMVRPS